MTQVKQNIMLAHRLVVSSTDGPKISELQIILLILPMRSYIVRHFKHLALVCFVLFLYFFQSLCPWIYILTTVEHNNGMGEFSIKVASATQSSYSQWASQTATITATTGTATATATYSTSPIPTATSYDYIVIGGGVRIIISSSRFLSCSRGIVKSSHLYGFLGCALLNLEC